MNLTEEKDKYKKTKEEILSNLDKKFKTFEKEQKAKPKTIVGIVRKTAQRFRAERRKLRDSGIEGARKAGIHILTRDESPVIDVLEKAVFGNGLTPSKKSDDDSKNPKQPIYIV